MSERASSPREEVVVPPRADVLQNEVAGTQLTSEIGAGHATAAPDAHDVALVARLRAGDESAFSELIERYYGSMLRLALVFVPSRAIAEEVVQETWVGVLDGLRTFEGRSTLKTWIFRILTNCAKTRGSRERRWFGSGAVSDADDSGAQEEATRFGWIGKWRTLPQWWDDETPEKLLTNAEALRCLENALTKLPANQRAVVVLRDIDGLDLHAVCSVLGISEANQRVLLHRGRSKLRAMLEDFIDGK